MGRVRAVEELRSEADAAWPGLEKMLAAARVPLVVLPPEGDTDAVVERLQAGASTSLGALAMNTGGVLVDHGWLRILGGGGAGLVDLASANALARPDVSDSASRPPLEGGGSLTVAFDVLGGRFAINRGELPGPEDDVCYWGPDTLEWMTLGASHEAFVAWAVSEALGTFYADLRWPGWEGEVEHVAAGEGLICYPFLFSAEGRNIEDTIRSAVPFEELLALHSDMARQVGYLPSAPAIKRRR